MTEIFRSFSIFGISLSIVFLQGAAYAQQNDKQTAEQQVPQLLAQPAQNAASNAAAPSTAGTPGTRTTPLSFAPLTGHEKFRYYLRSTYGPIAIGRSLAWAGVDQATDADPGWGQGMEGYAKRFGSKYGQLVIKRSIGQGLGALLHEDPRYFPSEESGLWPRTLYAVKWTFITRKDDGSYKFADARIIGTFSAALISRTWHPPGDNDFKSGMESGAISVGIDAGWNVFKEFWPDIRRRLRH